MNIRIMDITDYEEVYALWMSSRNMGFNHLDDSKEGIGRFLLRNPKTSFVAVEDEKLIGVCLAGHDGRRGYIYHMFVAEPYRKQKVGTRLLEKCIGALKEEGINKAALLVFKYNEAGSRFWEKQGFVVREDVDYRNLELAELIRIDT